MKKFAWLVLFAFLFIGPSTLQASPWAEKEGYFAKTAGKFGFGFKNAVFGWMQMFKESYDPKYATRWEGFCVGIARSVIYTANGLVHLATFPIPVDVPDIGDGL